MPNTKRKRKRTMPKSGQREKVTRAETFSTSGKHWDIRQETSATIEAIQQLHQICTPPAAIAKRMHLSETDMRFCIQRGRFPQSELFETEVSE